MTPEDSRRETQQHIDRVGELASVFTQMLTQRASCHDSSKMESPEVEAFAQATSRLKGLTYGSKAYKQQLEEFQECLRHHYSHNRHHPEHFEQGVEGMSLLDVVEMFCDWRAATERHADGNIVDSINHNAERFGLSPQLVAILMNTVEMFEKDGSSAS